MMICDDLRRGLAGVALASAWVAAADAQTQSTDIRRERTPIVSAFPEYPTRARRERLEGEATVCFTIDADGIVNRPRIRSSSHRMFKQPTLEAIKASTFEPLAEGQLESPIPVCRTYRYALNPLEPLYVSDAQDDTPTPAVARAENVAAQGTPNVAAGSISEDGEAPESAPAEPVIAPQDTLISRARLLPPEQPVCSTRRRSGTRIERVSCYTPIEHAAIERSKDRDIGLLQDQARSWIQVTPDIGAGGEYIKGNDLGPR